MKLTSLFVCIAALTTLAACSSRTKYDPVKSRIEKNGISVGANWVKDKGEKFDAQFVILNNTAKGAIVDLHEMSCSRGNLRGMLKHTFFNTGERTIDLRPGEMKMFNLVCNYGSDYKGNYNITVGKIYENANNDGRTRGPVMAENLAWVAEEK